ncbi:glycosyltransferase family 9 protein [Thermodesulfobacteriota bacterium]
MEVLTDCKFFKGDRPCIQHKEDGVHCGDCPHYKKKGKMILVIKLGAMGDVIRTTPLLHKLEEVYPDADITWLTDFPKVVPQDRVGNIVTLSPRAIPWLLSTKFDILYNLDKDREAVGLASLIPSEEKIGFLSEDGKCAPADENARHKWLTGLFDDENRKNMKSYPEEIFEICGFRFSGEKYIPPAKKEREFDFDIKYPLIGFNTGCGARWTTRLWPEEMWISLAKFLIERGYGVILLGGEEEHQKNSRIAQMSGAVYPGHFPVGEFFQLIDMTDLVVTSVTMALHVAIAQEKKIVLFNNVFNRNEFELYGLGKILEPERDCLGCFKTSCGEKCMELLPVDQVARTCEELLGREEQ